MFVGFDGGGTKCEGFVVDKSGTKIARFVGCSTNQNSVGWDVAIANFTSVVHGLCGQLSENVEFIVACLGMSGVDREPEKKRWTEVACSALHVGLENVIVSNDAVTALASGTGGFLKGVAVIAGTGTIAIAMNPGSISCRAQGWGPVLGDEGSGYAVGQSVLRAVARAHDGMDPATLLTSLVLTATGCARCEDLIGWAYKGPELPWARVAAIAPCAETAAANGDLAAQAILSRAADALFDAVRTCVIRCEGLPRPIDVVFSGGLLRDGSPISDLLQSRLQKGFCEDVKVVHPTISAAEAAALIAMRHKTNSL
jgi:N-acetylglucosamine kinase-like BadF-type ATPase